MPGPDSSPNIDLHLVKVLHTVVSERSVSRAAVRLHSSQPVVSAQLRRLRALTGDPLLVRSGRGLAPTDTALGLLEPAQRLLLEAERLFSPAQRGGAFVPATSTLSVRIAASDYLDPWFLPGLVARLKTAAPGLQVELHPLSAEFDYRRKLAAGEVDLVIGNWLQPPGELHLGRLTSDEVVCLVAADHPAARQPRAWTLERYLQAEHVAPTPLHAGAPGVIDEHGPADHRAQPPFQPDPGHGGAEFARPDHRPAVLRTFCRAIAGHNPALSRRVPAPGVLPAVA